MEPTTQTQEPRNTDLGGGTSIELRNAILGANTSEELHQTVKMITNWIAAIKPTVVARQCIQDYFDRKASELNYSTFLNSLAQ